MAEYYNVTTNLGDAEIANAIATNTKLNITHIAFGDGNGSVPTPNKARTSLVREVHRQAVTKYERHATNANWIVIETIIPSSIGGFWVREMGIIANGKLISHGSHAPFEKVADPSGVSEYRLRFTQNVTDGSVVEITLDESLIYASQAWVEENFIKRTEIVDNLITADPNKPLSANAGKSLQDGKLGKNDNAVSATKLQTARTITYTGAATGSFNFDGSGNVSCALTLSNLDASKITSGTIPAARIPTLNQSTTGNAATATKLATPRTINGVSFNGTANITIADSTKLPLTGGALTGDVTLSGAGRLINLGAANTNAIRTRGVQGIKTDNSASDGLYLNPEGGRVYFGVNQSYIDEANFSGNAATATKLATPRTINGVNFDGTTNISIPTATTSVSGTVRLNNTLTSTSTTEAATANTVKLLNDRFINDFLNLKSENGYQKLPSGLIIQWGKFTAVTNYGSGQLVSLPIAFPNRVLFAVFSEDAIATTVIETAQWVPSTTTKSQLCVATYYNGDCYYFALGY